MPVIPPDPGADSGGSPGADEGYLPGSSGLRRASWALFLAGVAVFALLYAPQPLLPLLASDFSQTPAAATLAVSATTAALAVGLLVAGPVSERFGRTRLVHSSLVLASVLGLVAVLAPTWDWLVALRAVQGLALAGLPAVAVAYLREEVHPLAAGRATGLYVGGNAIGGMLGRLVSSGLAELGGWKAAQGGVAVLGLVCAALVWWLLPRSRRFTPAPAGLRALAHRTRGVVTDPALLALYGLSLTLMGSFVAVWNAIGFRLEAPPYSLGPAVAGLVFTVYALGSYTSAQGGRLADALGRRVVVPVSVVVMGVGLAITVAAPLWAVIVGMAVFTAGFFAAHGVASGWVAARAGAGGRATAQAASTYLFAYYVGSSLGGTGGGVAWSAGGWSAVVLLAGAAALVALVLTGLLARTRPLLPPSSTSHPAPGAG
ncbi:MFS transporter, YNFM family, putative membrane transport protein [Quadrisphaera granulorum]|uniref:YNFM family putative membrane transporter n=1 Tax=Quadrisphaera granulorum TaxID=317664 RepID=A0A316A7V3_9ACTN|nr:YNFM family putative membrane transporter [Quadrisphaera granulorum]SZE96388.1 MFS transporter, YNFM family, putative membrane transport protein [Quadrisphaera granulorum]